MNQPGNPSTPTPEDPRQNEPIHDPPVHPEHDPGQKKQARKAANVEAGETEPDRVVIDTNKTER